MRVLGNSGWTNGLLKGARHDPALDAFATFRGQGGSRLEILAMEIKFYSPPIVYVSVLALLGTTW